MKRVFLIIILLLLAVLLYGEEFRGLEWGSSYEDMVEKEGEPEAQHEGWYIYERTVANLPMFAAFGFYKGQLVTGKYGLRKTYVNENKYIEDFEYLKTQLTNIYGVPNYDTNRWSNSLYKDDPDDYGFAISIGHLTMYSNWETEDTEIALLLEGDNYECSLTIHYESTRLADLIKEHDEKVKSEGL